MAAYYLLPPPTPSGMVSSANDLLAQCLHSPTQARDRGHPGLGAGLRGVTLLRCPALTGLETAHLTCKSKNRMCNIS